MNLCLTPALAAGWLVPSPVQLAWRPCRPRVQLVQLTWCVRHVCTVAVCVHADSLGRRSNRRSKWTALAAVCLAPCRPDSASGWVVCGVASVRERVWLGCSWAELGWVEWVLTLDSQRWVNE